MFTLLLTLALTRPVPAQHLAHRLRSRTCEDAILDPFDVASARRIRARVNTAGRFLLPDGARIDMLADLNQRPQPAEAYERAVQIEDALCALVNAGSFPLSFQPVAYSDWQMDVWPAVTTPPTRRCFLLADHLGIKPKSAHLSSGEFVVAIRFDRELGVDLIERLIELALDRSRIDPRLLKGVVSNRRYHAGHAYLTLDEDADPEVRFRRTLRLLNALNDELFALGVRLY